MKEEVASSYSSCVLQYQNISILHHYNQRTSLWSLFFFFFFAKKKITAIIIIIIIANQPNVDKASSVRSVPINHCSLYYVSCLNDDEQKTMFMM